MDADNFTSQKTILIEPTGNEKKSGFGKPMLWMQSAVFLLGLALLFYVTYNAGFKTLGETLSRVGWGFLLVVFLNGSRHLLRAVSMFMVIPPEHRQFKFREAIMARLGGEAVSFVTFTGPFLGEATKAALLKRNMPLVQSSAAIIVDNILYYISVILLILCGVGVMTFAYSSEQSVTDALYIVTALCLLAFVGMFLMLWFR